MKNRVKATAILAIVGAFAAGCASDNNHHAQQNPPDMEAMMQEWMEMTAPDEHHRDMANAVGTWDVQMKMWMAPGTPPQNSQATADIELILDGRYLLENMRGQMDWGDGPMPFHGMNLIGYDTFKKEFINCWVDNYSTGMMINHGKESADGKTVTYWGEVPDPMTRKMKTMKSELVKVSNDKMIFRMFDKGPDGKEFVHMEGTYTRR